MALSLRNYQDMLAGFESTGYVCTRAPRTQTNPLQSPAQDGPAAYARPPRQCSGLDRMRLSLEAFLRVRLEPMISWRDQCG